MKMDTHPRGYYSAEHGVVSLPTSKRGTWSDCHSFFPPVLFESSGIGRTYDERSVRRITLSSRLVCKARYVYVISQEELDGTLVEEDWEQRYFSGGNVIQCKLKSKLNQLMIMITMSL